MRGDSSILSIGGYKIFINFTILKLIKLIYD